MKEQGSGYLSCVLLPAQVTWSGLGTKGSGEVLQNEVDDAEN